MIWASALLWASLSASPVSPAPEPVAPVEQTATVPTPGANDGALSPLPTLVPAPVGGAPSAALDLRPHPRSIYRISPWVDGSVTVGAGLGLLLPTLFARQLVHPTCPCSRSNVTGLDAGVLNFHAKWAAPVSDVTLGISLALPLVMDAVDVGFTQELGEDALVYGEVLAVSGALQNLAKYGVQRPRPFVYSATSAATLQAPDSYASFYSGHTSFVLAALTAASFTYTRRHGPAWWPWLVTGLVGLSVAAERVASGNHFYSDVAVGAVAGFVCGYLIPEMHVRLPAAAGLGIAPLPGGAQLSFGRTF